MTRIQIDKNSRLAPHLAQNLNYSGVQQHKAALDFTGCHWHKDKSGANRFEESDGYTTVLSGNPFENGFSTRMAAGSPGHRKMA